MSNEAIVQIHEQQIKGKWDPSQGQTLKRLLESNTSLSSNEKNRLVSETLSIMRQCADPNMPNGRNTGLIIGYVQSGKTLSFTSLSALARDNGYQIIILLAGTTNNLVEQSFERLKKDLEVKKNRYWMLFSTKDKGFQSDEIDRVKSELTKQRKDNNRRRTILIVSMKNHHHLSGLTELLAGVDLSNAPTLIIDDEGDQAGMNVKAQVKEESTTYARITKLRDLFPHHSYLLYTATPQAPLLIDRIDVLSPDFGVVLMPGDNYVGGKEFFIDGDEKYIKLIPRKDVPDRDDPPTSPPNSMLRAMKDFFVGVAIGLQEKEDDQADKNRSMMIHPAIPRIDHLMFARWAQSTRAEWKAILSDPSHPDYDDLLVDFSAAFDCLTETHSIDYGFDQIKPLLYDAVSDTAITELNTRKKPKLPVIDWTRHYSMILVGGIGLDRGFTVEGLTVSYMPRSTGVGNVDNIQQRARFFGYKQHYLGLCRIYLTNENICAFQDYVSHEESVRQSISQHIKSGGTLKDWRRTWRLKSPLRPTRQSVIMLNMYQSSGRAGWFYPKYPYSRTDFVADNRETTDQLLSAFEFQEYREEGWNEKQAIPCFSDEILLGKIIPFILRFCYEDPPDKQQHSFVTLTLGSLADKYPDMRCSVYAFSGPWSGVNARRSLDTKNPPQIRNLFQGSNARTNYPGARRIHSEDTITFQIHRYDLEDPAKEYVMLKDLPVLAVHIPKHLAERIWVEY